IETTSFPAAATRPTLGFRRFAVSRTTFRGDGTSIPATERVMRPGRPGTRAVMPRGASAYRCWMLPFCAASSRTPAASSCPKTLAARGTRLILSSADTPHRPSQVVALGRRVFRRRSVAQRGHVLVGIDETDQFGL